jgi:HAD superfamily phosphoserine phosphatase-like hydrolase
VEQRRIVVSDVEGTLTTGETWRGVAAWLRANGRGWSYWRFFLGRVPALLAVRFGRSDRQAFRDAWVAGLAGFFRGLDGEALAELAEWVVERELWPSRRAALVAEVTAIAEHGGRVILASGTYQPVLEAFARRIGAEAVGTPLEMSDGRATGRTAGPVTTGTRKADAVRRYVAGPIPDRCYGDSAADVPMLEMAREPVAVFPDHELAAIAVERRWRIVGVPDRDPRAPAP